MKESDLLFGLLISFHKEEFSFSDIEWLTAPFNISQSSLRTNLSRMASNEVLNVRREGKKAFYRFTNKSQKLGSNVALSFNTPNWSGWGGDWWGISISLPQHERSLRYSINRKLAHYRFASLHPGFWIRPFNQAENIEKKLSDVVNHKNSKTIIFRFHSDEELLHIPAIWNLSEINEGFKSCLDYVLKCYDHYHLDNPEEALVGKMTVGNTVVKQLFKDPLLPPQFLPQDWVADKLREAFKQWDLLTTQNSKPYWEKIFNDDNSN